jgi:hypothetical protein
LQSLFFVFWKIFAVLATTSVLVAFKQRLFAPNEVERKSVRCAQVEVRAR